MTSRAQTLTTLITAVTAIGALVFTGLSLSSTRDQVAIAQAQTTLAEQGQITDRYSKAVGQLDSAGAEHLQARLGAVYAMERLAHDSARDQPTIVEVLSAFIRSTAATPTGNTGFGQGAVSCPAQRPGVDVQAALTVLGRRDISRDNSTRISLGHTCLGQVFLPHARLRDADLEFAAAKAADLRQADLRDATLNVSDLTNADLADADLAGAKLNFARLNSESPGTADLTGATLDGAELGEASLSAANLRGAGLRGCDLRAANLRGADLRGANLTGADLRGAELTGVAHDRATGVQGARTDDSTIGAWW